MIVKSVNIGKKKVIKYKGKKIETGIYKFPVQQSIFLEAENVQNDVVMDRKHHGGIDQAVYGYSENHYKYWTQLYPELDWKFGMFGENLTISNLEETEIFIGNRYRLGSAIIEVTKPRKPCIKLGLRFKTQQVLKQFWNTTKSGIYFKVINAGNVSKGDELLLIHKAENSPTIADVFKASAE